MAAANSKEDPDLTLMEAMERNTILQMLKETNGNKLETAKRLASDVKPCITRSKCTQSSRRTSGDWSAFNFAGGKNCCLFVMALV